MDKYKRLASNTVIFAISTFSSKFLVFLLMPLYTWALSPAEYSVTDLIVQCGNLLLPLVTLGIVNAIIRFGLDKSVNKSQVLTNGFLTLFIGFILLLCFAPLISMVKTIAGHTLLVYIFVLTSSLRSICSQFVRARGLVKLFAFDGILSTITTIIFNILFLVVFKFGVIGYIMAIVCSDLLSATFLFFIASLWRYVDFKHINLPLWKEMILYSLPLIPNMICWWITNVSDRFIVSYMLGNEANGLYAVSYKLPTIISVCSTIFISAWQISAITEEKGRSRFFSKIFKSYSALIFMVGAVLIPFSKLAVILLAQDSYYGAWEYIPFLVMATVFNCFGAFAGSVYTVEKKSIFSFATISVGAIINVVLNIILIPIWGVNGAAFATFFCYFVVFILRVITARKLIKMRVYPMRTTVNTIILLIQSLVMIFETPGWIFIEAVLVLGLLLFNLKPLIQVLMTILKRKKH